MTDVKTLIDRGNKLFADKSSLDSLHQELADNFYPERGGFTRTWNLGEDFAAGLQSSYPILVRRDLGNAISSMLRPRNRQWFHMTIDGDEDKLSKTSRSWLEWATDRMRKPMLDRVSGFMRATKEGDHDFATFGQCVIQPELDWNNGSLLYMNWHIKDCAWLEGANGMIDQFYRNWRPTARQLVSKYGTTKCHADTVKLADDHPNDTVKVLCVSMPAGDYEDNKKNRHKWIYLVIDVERQHIIEEVNRPRFGYVIPRWQTVSGSAYAYSPAAIAGLPDARLIQAMTHTLLRAGEMAVWPPLAAKKDALREDVQYFPGGISWVDAEYDQRAGYAVEPFMRDKSGLPFGMDFANDIRSMLASAFYLNKISMPNLAALGGDRTAYEIGQYVEQYIREALPLFEPMEVEYNGGLCEDTFELVLPTGILGSWSDIPQELRGKDITFRFESPLHDALERKRGATFLEAKQLLREAYELDQSTLYTMDARTAVREALTGIGTPADWLNSEDAVEKYAKDLEAQRQARIEAERVGEAASSAESLGKAAQAFS